MLASRQRARQPGPVHGPAAGRAVASADAPAVLGGTTLARAERLGHCIDRLPLGRIQRVFSEELARTLVVQNTPDVTAVGDWPANEPPNPWAWFRNRPGVARLIDTNGRWRDDVDGQPTSRDRVVAAIRSRFAEVLAERARLAEVAREAAAQALADAVPQTLQNHVCLGDFNGPTPTGFHSKAGNSATHEAYGGTTVVDGALGIYQQSVRGRRNADAAWARKGIQSTFFPDQIGGRAATDNDVRLALGTGRASAHRRVSYPIEWRNMTLTRIGDTWFPAGGTDRLAAPLP